MTKQTVAFRNFANAPKNEADKGTTDQKIEHLYGILNSSRFHKRLIIDPVLMRLDLSEYLMPTSQY
jgi:hypothetical protein